MMRRGPERIVIAPYARKVLGMAPTGFGMGFCRIHRSVFQMLDGLVDENGEEQLGRYYIEGQGVATHYFFTGTYKQYALVAARTPGSGTSQH